MADPRWLKRAKEYIGLREFPGKQHNPFILRMWSLIKAPFKDDETPWCAGFVGGVLEEVDLPDLPKVTFGIMSTRSAMARSYVKYGKALSKPYPGCIVVFWRGSKSGSQGHVGFFDGYDQHGNLWIVGGNQGDRVSRAIFGRDRVLAYRWPPGEPLPDAVPVAVSKSDGKVSTNEA